MHYLYLFVQNIFATKEESSKEKDVISETSDQSNKLSEGACALIKEEVEPLSTELETEEERNARKNLEWLGIEDGKDKRKDTKSESTLKLQNEVKLEDLIETIKIFDPRSDEKSENNSDVVGGLKSDEKSVKDETEQKE